MNAATGQEFIRLMERSEVRDDVRALYDVLLQQRGVVPNMFKTLAHAPDLAMGVAACLKPLLGDGALPGWYKELIATRISWLRNCAYGISSHGALAKRKGATDEQVEATRDPLPATRAVHRGRKAGIFLCRPSARGRTQFG